MRTVYFFILSTFLFTMSSCGHRNNTTITPWGTTVGGDEVGADTMNNSKFSYDDILANGELIMLTFSGSETYFDYRGKSMGTQYLICEKFAQKIGVSLRVEVCKNTADLMRRLINGEGDVAAVQLPRTQPNLLYCGATDSVHHTAWCVSVGNKELADSLNHWYTPSILAEVKREERFAFSLASVHRHVYAPMLNVGKGQISQYDTFFKMYAPRARWDWRLMAAQCYQESTFDARAYSWAGARGLMQIMPSTAASLGLTEAELYNPQANIEAASRYIARLNGLFNDVRNSNERINFVLASYNGGHFHVRDAMALARKNGKNPYLWSDVSEFVLKLSSPSYYNDPVVKYGYMRGSETVDYVERIRQRWNQYRRKVAGGSIYVPMGDGSGSYTPQKAQRKSKYHI